MTVTAWLSTHHQVGTQWPEGHHVGHCQGEGGHLVTVCLRHRKGDRSIVRLQFRFILCAGVAQRGREMHGSQFVHSVSSPRSRLNSSIERTPIPPTP